MFGKFTHANLKTSILVALDKILYIYPSDANKCIHLVMEGGEKSVVIPVTEDVDSIIECLNAQKKGAP